MLLHIFIFRLNKNSNHLSDFIHRSIHCQSKHKKRVEKIMIFDKAMITIEMVVLTSPVPALTLSTELTVAVANSSLRSQSSKIRSTANWYWRAWHAGNLYCHQPVAQPIL